MSVDLTTAKAHCRVSGSSEDTIITAYLNAAKAWIERYTGKNLASASETDYFTEFGDYLELLTGPYDTITLTSINYTDEAGDAATVDTDTVFLVDGRVYPPEAGWPTPLANSPINVVYSAGFSSVPADLDVATLVLVQHFYERGFDAPIPDTVEECCRPFRKPTLR